MIVGSAKRAVKRSLASPLGWRVLGPLVRAPGVIVLMYHRILGEDRTLGGVPVEEFEAHMRWVRDNCDPIGPDELRTRAGKPSRIKPAVLVTFDDGYRDYHDRAYPILKRLGIPAVVFVATSFLDEGGVIWTEAVEVAAATTKKERVRLPWSGEEVRLSDAAARERLGLSARAYLKTLPDAERRARLGELIAELGPLPERERQMLTWDEVRRTLDLTTFGGHSHTHPILARLDRDACEREIRTCQQRIAAETGRAPRYFAYPNGRPGDYTAETQEILRRHGFTVAFSTSEGIADANSDWMAVKRLPGLGSDAGEFAWLMAGRMRFDARRDYEPGRR